MPRSVLYSWVQYKPQNVLTTFGLSPLQPANSNDAIDTPRTPAKVFAMGRLYALGDAAGAVRNVVAGRYGEHLTTQQLEEILRSTGYGLPPETLN